MGSQLFWKNEKREYVIKSGLEIKINVFFQTSEAPIFKKSLLLYALAFIRFFMFLFAFLYVVTSCVRNGAKWGEAL